MRQIGWIDERMTELERAPGSSAAAGAGLRPWETRASSVRRGRGAQAAWREVQEEIVRPRRAGGGSVPGRLVVALGGRNRRSPCCAAKPQMRVVRAGADRPVAGDQGFVGLAGEGQQAAEFAMGGGQDGVEFQGAALFGHVLRGLAHGQSTTPSVKWAKASDPDTEIALSARR